MICARKLLKIRPTNLVQEMSTLKIVDALANIDLQGHGRDQRRMPKSKTYKRVGIAGAAAALLLTAAMLVPGTSNAADTFPSQDACGVTNNDAPLGNCGSFTQVYRETFGGANVALGKFSDCAGDGDHRCEGLVGTRYYDTLGAYPNGWEDTATSGNDGNGGRTFGGYYRPQDTMSVITQPNGDGQMRVNMWRGASGSIHSAAPVPRRCMNMRYGKFSERVVVRTNTDGYKMAHLRYTPNEVDYPEAGGNFATDTISAYTHGFASSNTTIAPNSAWTSWHTYSTEITPGKIKFFFDGKLMKTVNADFPDNADWILQNEAALGGGYAAPNSSVTIDTTWLTCYKYVAPAKKKK